MKYRLMNHVALCGSLFLISFSGTARAQTTGALNPNSAPDQRSQDAVPPGGCMPIGLTASGEMVFPMLCKELLEQQREKAADQKPAVSGEKKAATKPMETVPSAEDETPENNSPKPAAAEEMGTAKLPAETAPSSKHLVPESRPEPAMAEGGGRVTAKAVETTPPSQDVSPEIHNSEPKAAETEYRTSDGGSINRPTAPTLSQKAFKHGLRGRRIIHQDGCEHYRTYDAKSETYRSYDGRHRSCR
jgi:hypothetical protein